MTIALYARFTALTGAEDAVSSLIGDYAATVRREPGNLSFDAYRIADAPADIFVHEQYVDQAAFDLHLASAAGAVFNLALAPLVVGGGSTLTMLHPISVTSNGAGS